MRRSCYHLRLLQSASVHLAIVLASLVGCGTTRSTDTGRAATEQLLISDAIDRAVQTVDFTALRGQTVFLDDSRLGDTVDRNYLVSTLRQHLLASGCALRDKADDAEFVVEARAGAIGTDRNDLLFGVPSMNVPQILPAQPTPAAIPEIPLAKRRDQRGVAKIAVFAYHRRTGSPVWQSGLAQRESSSNDVWILGAGPFQRGTIYEGTTFAGQAIGTTSQEALERVEPQQSVDLADQKHFASPAKLAAANAPPLTADASQSAAQQTPQSPAAGMPAPAAVALAPNSTSESARSRPEAQEQMGATTNTAYANLFATPLKRINDGLAAKTHESRADNSTNRYGEASSSDAAPASW
jgi:hypothetical protein